MKITRALVTIRLLEYKRVSFYACPRGPVYHKDVLGELSRRSARQSVMSVASYNYAVERDVYIDICAVVAGRRNDGMFPGTQAP